MSDFLEVYTPHETFKVQTPEVIDPGRTNPNAPWMRVKTHEVGCASPFVARTIITANRMLSPLGDHESARDTAIRTLMHGIKETLLQCAMASDLFCKAVDDAVSTANASGFKKTGGINSLEVFPIVQDISGKTTAFLISTRRVITEICQVPAIFWQSDRTHSALEHLLEKDLEKRLGEDHPLIQFLRGFASGTKRILDLRNGQEHSLTTRGLRLEVRNFEHLPNGQIRHPVWFLEGEEPENICATMKAVPDFLLNLAEGMFVGALAATLPAWPPFVVAPVAEPNPLCPVQYQLTIDPSSFTFRVGD